MKKIIQKSHRPCRYRAFILLLHLFSFLMDVNSNAVNAKYSAAHLADPENLLMLEEICKDHNFQQNNEISILADKIVQDYPSILPPETDNKEKVKFDKTDSELYKKASVAALKDIFTDSISKKDKRCSTLQQEALKNATDKFYKAIVENNFKRGCYNLRTGNYSNELSSDLSSNVVCLSGSDKCPKNKFRNKDVLWISDKEVKEMIKNRELDTKGIVGALCFRNGNLSGLMKFVLSEWLNKKSSAEKEEIIAKFHLLEESRDDTDNNISPSVFDNTNINEALPYLNFFKLPYIIMSNTSYSALAALALFITRKGHSHFLSPWNLAFYACSFYGILALDKLLNYSIFKQSRGGLFGRIIEYALNMFGNNIDMIRIGEKKDFCTDESSDQNQLEGEHIQELIATNDEPIEELQDVTDGLIKAYPDLVNASTQTEFQDVVDDDILSSSSCDTINLDESKGFAQEIKDLLLSIQNTPNILFHEIKDKCIDIMHRASNTMRNHDKSKRKSSIIKSRARNSNDTAAVYETDMDWREGLIMKSKEIVSKLFKRNNGVEDKKSAESVKILPEDIKNINGMIKAINENPSLHNDLSEYFEKMFIQYEKDAESSKSNSALIAAIDLIFTNPAGVTGRCAMELNEVGVESPSWKLSLIANVIHAIKSRLSFVTPWYDQVLDVANKPIVQLLAFPATIFRTIRNSLLALAESKPEIQQKTSGTSTTAAVASKQSHRLEDIKKWTKYVLGAITTPASVGYALVNTGTGSFAKVLGAGLRNIISADLTFWMFSGLDYLVGDSFSQEIPTFYTIGPKRNLNTFTKAWLYINSTAYLFTKAVKLAPKVINTLGYASIAYWGYKHIPAVVLSLSFGYSLKLLGWLLCVNILDRVSGVMEKMSFRKSPTADRIDEYFLDVDRLIQDIERTKGYKKDNLAQAAS